MTFFEDHLRAVGQTLDACAEWIADRVHGAARFRREGRYRPARSVGGGRSFGSEGWWRDTAEQIERWLSRYGVHAPVERVGRVVAAVSLIGVIVGGPMLGWHLANRPSGGSLTESQRDQAAGLSAQIVSQRAGSLHPGSPNVVGKK